MTRALSRLLIVTLAFPTLSAFADIPPAPGPRRDDPFRRMCYELQRRGICNEACGIRPPGCVSGEEAARKRACAIGRMNGTLNEKCEPVVLPIPPGAPDENLAIASRVKRGTMYWNVWSTCKGCGWTMDEVILYPEGKYAAFYHASKQVSGRGTIISGTGEKGWAPLIRTTNLAARFVWFNPMLCPRGAGSCHPVRNVIVVDDVARQQSRQYTSFEDFAKAEGNPFTCELSPAGEAKCDFHLPPKVH